MAFNVDVFVEGRFDVANVRLFTQPESNARSPRAVARWLVHKSEGINPIRFARRRAPNGPSRPNGPPDSAETPPSLAEKPIGLKLTTAPQCGPAYLFRAT